MAKSRDAFRTISEVAEWLDTPAHVLRFWESKFSQVKPVKRAGGRRYYRPADMLLLAGLKKLLHEDGLTIKGVQKVLREKGVKHVASLADMPVDEEDTLDSADTASAGEVPAAQMHEDAPALPASDDEGTVVPFAGRGAAEEIPIASDSDAVPEIDAADDVAPTPEAPTPAPEHVPEPELQLEPEPERSEEIPAALSPAELASPDAEDVGDERVDDVGPDEDETPDIVEETAEALPDFITGGASSDSAPATAEETVSGPLGADIPSDPVDDEITAAPGPLSRMAKVDRLTPDMAAQLAPYIEQLRELSSARAR